MAGHYQQIILTGSTDLRALAVYLWLPEEEPRGVVQIIHGMREHMGRYDAFACWLAQRGFAVCGHDQMGHGKTRGADGAFGYFGEEEGALRLVRDCRRITRLIQRELPGLPIFLLGHSMGSFVGRMTILHCARELAGFLCMGTGGPNPMAPLGRGLAQQQIARHGSKADGVLLDRLIFSGYNDRFPKEGGNAWLSRDPAVPIAYEADPLIGRYFTNAGFRDLFDLQIAATSPRWARQVDPSLPIFLLAGEEDPVGDYGRGPLETYHRLKAAGARDLSLHLYPEARHELLQETCREDVFSDILFWIKQRLV